MLGYSRSWLEPKTTGSRVDSSGIFQTLARVSEQGGRLVGMEVTGFAGGYHRHKVNITGKQPPLRTYIYIYN